MRKQMYLTISIILLLSLFVAGPSSSAFASRLNATPPTLGDVASYSVLAGSIVTNIGPTTVQGDLGVSPGIGQPPLVTGFPPGVVGPPGMIHIQDGHAAAAQAANTAAFGQLDQPCDITYSGVKDLSGLSLEPGVYCATAFLLTENLTLTGSGVWIFKSASTLTLNQGASVIGGDPCNIWWRVGSSATLGVNSSLIGDVLALTSVALQTGATLNGRALAQTGAVTLDSNTILGPICVQLPTSTPTSAATATATATATVTATATANVPTPTGTYIPPTATAEVATATPASTATATEDMPTPTGTYIPPTATAEVPTATNMPVMTALPPTGGAPLQSESSPWGLLIIGGFSALALVLGSRAYRKTSKPRQ